MSWSSVELGSICEILDSKRKPITKNQRTDGPYPYYGATGIVDYVGSFIFDEKLILIGEDGAKWASGDKTAFIANGKYWVNNHAHVIKPNREVVCDEWLVYYFLHKDLGEYVSGLTVPKLNQGQLKIIPIPLPSLATQRKIVAKLDAIFAEIDKAVLATETNVKNSEALFDYYLIDFFSKNKCHGKKYNLGDLCETLHQGLNTAGEKIKFHEYGFPIIQTRNIDKGLIDVSEKLKFLSASDWAKYKDKYKPEIGDVFFTNIGTIGKTAIVTEEEDYLIHWNIFKIRPNSNLITSKFMKLYLDYLTKSRYFSDRQKGGTVEFVTKKMISEVLVAIPEIENQIILSNKFDALHDFSERAKESYAQKLFELSGLRQSILKQAFNGELVKD